MAAYAAYRHVELDHVGYGKRRMMKRPEAERDLWGADFKGSPCHQRVLKPPGGGSSDIFGSPEQQQSPRKVKQHMASNVILSDEVPPSSGPGSTASSTSSGSAPDTPSSPTRNGTVPVPAPAGITSHDRLFGSSDDNDCDKSARRNFQMESHFVLGYDKTPEKGPKEDQVDAEDAEGNPVTGEGYAHQNGATKLNGSPQGPTVRTRVPPGGYSSGLW